MVTPSLQHYVEEAKNGGRRTYGRPEFCALSVGYSGGVLRWRTLAS